MGVSRRIRFEVLRRDGHTCRYCGASAPDVPLHVDHVIPVALGGGDDPANLVTACADCNSGKASTAPDQAVVEDVDAAAMLFAKALEKAVADREVERGRDNEVIAQFDDVWDSYTYSSSDEKVPRPSDWPSSIRRFSSCGLTIGELSDAAVTAMERPGITGRYGEWRFFCRLCWDKVTDLQEAARRAIEDGVV